MIMKTPTLFYAVASSFLTVSRAQPQHQHQQQQQQQHQRQLLRGASAPAASAAAAAAEREPNLFVDEPPRHASSERMSNGVGHFDSHRNSYATSLGYGPEVAKSSSSSSLFDDAANVDAGGSSWSSSPPAVPSVRFCKSIIAIGNSRLPPDDPFYGLYYDARGRARGLSSSSSSAVDEMEETEESDGFDEEFVCELHTGDTVPIRSTPRQLGEMRRMLNEGALVSAVSTISIQEEEEEEEAGAADDDEGGASSAGATKPPLVAGMAQSQGAAAAVAAATPSFDGVTLPPGAVRIATDPDRELRRDGRRRRLATYSGRKPVLVVRITDSDLLAVPQTAAEVSDKFFGTGGDEENMRSQFASCSFGGLNVTYDDYGVDTDAIADKLSAPGVLEIDIPISIQTSEQSAIRYEANKAVRAKLLGLVSYLPGPFDHVLYVVEGCYVGCGWAAYAYVNSWLSMYQAHYHYMPAVQMHELGHNLNLAHSGGLNGKTYTDHTCLMGNPLFSDTVGDMCFNPAKNWQIVNSGESSPTKGNWYSKERVEVFDSNGGGEEWNGMLVGIAEMDTMNTTFHENSKVILKIESGTSDDLYVGFNRAVNFNEDNVLADDKVTIVETGGNGVEYSQSWLKATLFSREQYRRPNFRNGEELVVTVENIKTDVEPGYAKIIVRLGEKDDAVPTRNPTRIPTDDPTALPTSNPTSSPSKSPTLSPHTSSPTVNPTKGPTTSPTSSPTKTPTPSPTISPTKNPTSPPTSSPTKNPTSSPSNSPTKSPSTPDSPTASPSTLSPTKSPTKSPSLAPTMRPTSSPTSSPTISSNIIELNTTVFAPNKAANGTMFTVEAIHTGVSIKSLSAYTHEVESNQPVEVYYRPGSYTGHTDSDDGWTLILSDNVDLNGMESVTRLGPFTQEVKVLAGESVSFYVYTTSKLRYQYRDAWKDGDALLHDSNLKLYAGIALAYGKWKQGCGAASPDNGHCIYTPRVFSGFIEYSIPSTADKSASGTTTYTAAPQPTDVPSNMPTHEPSNEPTSRPSKSPTNQPTVAPSNYPTKQPTAAGQVTQKFTTLDSKDAIHKARGLMFTVKAKRDATIDGFDIIPRRSKSDIKIYVLDGDYNNNDKALDEDEWDEVFDESLRDIDPQKLLELKDFSTEVRFKKDEVKSFYVWNKKGLMCKKNHIDSEGTSYVANDAFEIRSGREMAKELFQTDTKSGEFAGLIRYHEG